MKTTEAAKSIGLIFLVLFLAACAEEAQPYEEINNSHSKNYAQGAIQTH